MKSTHYSSYESFLSFLFRCDMGWHLALVAVTFIGLYSCGGASDSEQRSLPSAAGSSAIEVDLLALANQERTSRGLSELESNEQLKSIARNHSKDMADHDFLAHTSPTTGTPADRAEKAGLHSGLILENVGKGPDARGIHQALMNSPGHRANLLNPDVTDIGIASVVSGRDYVITQLFAQLAKAIDVDRAPADLLKLLNQSRQSRGASALQMDKHLAEAAQHGADIFFEDASLSQQDAVDEATATMRKFAIAFKRVAGVMTLVPNLKSASTLEPALEPDIEYIGIGVAQGDREDTGPRAIAVVLLLGWAR